MYDLTIEIGIFLDILSVLQARRLSVISQLICRLTKRSVARQNRLPEFKNALMK